MPTNTVCLHCQGLPIFKVGSLYIKCGLDGICAPNLKFSLKGSCKKAVWPLKLKKMVLSRKEGHRHSIHPADSCQSINDILKYAVAGYCFVQHLFGDG